MLWPEAPVALACRRPANAATRRLSGCAWASKPDCGALSRSRTNTTCIAHDISGIGMIEFCSFLRLGLAYADY